MQRRGAFSRLAWFYKKCGCIFADGSTQGKHTNLKETEWKQKNNYQIRTANKFLQIFLGNSRARNGVSLKLFQRFPPLHFIQLSLVEDLENLIKLARVRAHALLEEYNILSSLFLLFGIFFNNSIWAARENNSYRSIEGSMNTQYPCIYKKKVYCYSKCFSNHN